MISINLIHKPIFQTQPNIIHYFLRHHLHVYLKILAKDPRKFWVALKINIGQSFCQKHSVSNRYFVQWISNLSQNPILQYQRFVASFSFVIIIDDAKMIEMSLSIFSLFQVGYCNSNTVGTTTPNIRSSYLTYSKQKITIMIKIPK